MNKITAFFLAVIAFFTGIFGSAGNRINIGIIPVGNILSYSAKTIIPRPVCNPR